MRIESSESSGNFAAGFISALLLLGALTVGVRAVRWLTTTDVAAAVVTWWTTPIAVTPADVVTSLLPLAVVPLFALTTLAAMAHGFRGGNV